MKKLYILTIASFIVTTITAQIVTEKSSTQKGYFNLTSASIIVGSPDATFETNAVIPSFTMVNGYNFNDRFSAGIGVGAEIFKYSVFPVFADFRYKFYRTTGYYPYIALRGGYGFANSSKNIMNTDYYYDNYTYKNKGGLMLNPEVGIYLPIGKKCDLTLSLGYRYQRLETDISKPGFDPNSIYYNNLSPYPTPIADSQENIVTTLNRLSFSIGFQFR